jgi:hypothetical protein
VGKNQEGFISDFQKKIRSCQKPSWFDKHSIIKLLDYSIIFTPPSDLPANGIEFKKTRKVLFRTFEKIRSCQKPSWFDPS